MSNNDQSTPQSISDLEKQLDEKYGPKIKPEAVNINELLGKEIDPESRNYIIDLIADFQEGVIHGPAFKIALAGKIGHSELYYKITKTLGIRADDVDLATTNKNSNVA